jgi:hypothetical protein
LVRIESKTQENPRNFSFPTRYTLVQQAGKMNIKKSGIFTRIGRIRRLVVRRLVAFGDWSHFRKFGDWSFEDWSFEDWSFEDWSFGEWSFGDWSVYPPNSYRNFQIILPFCYYFRRPSSHIIEKTIILKIKHCN